MEHAKKVLERVVNNRLREIVDSVESSVFSRMNLGRR